MLKGGEEVEGGRWWEGGMDETVGFLRFVFLKLFLLGGFFDIWSL